MTISNEISTRRFPVGLFWVAMAIPLLGLLNLASAAKVTRPGLWMTQSVWLAIAGGVVLAVVLCPPRVIHRFAYPIYLGVNVLLVLVLVAGLKIKGAQRWLDLGFFHLQPSELAKISIILITARYFAAYNVPGGYTLRMLFRPFNLSRILVGWGLFIFAAMNQFNGTPIKEQVLPLWVWGILLLLLLLFTALCFSKLWVEGLHHRQLIAPIDIAFIPFALIVIEPDLGTSLIVLAIAGVMILFCGIRWQSLLIAGLLGVITVVFGWNLLLKDYQKQRVETFLHPEADMHGAGYHSMQSMIAIGSGQKTGKGFMEGTQTQLSFLPENHTDFAFSVWAEEWGFLGSVFLIMAFGLLLLFMIQVGQKSKDRFSALMCVGAAAMLFWHVLINIGMVTGLMPVVGVTLPLVSYGGSSLITQVIALGLVFNVSLGRRVPNASPVRVTQR